MKVLYEDNHLLVVEKPVNVPVQADSSNDPDLLTMAKAYIKDRYSKPGNVYLGLVHRLDRPVGGVMVFARTSKAAARLSDTIRNRKMKKTYLAVLDGIPAEKTAVLEDWLQKDQKTNTTWTTDREHGKYARLSYRILAVHDRRALAEITLDTGRSHQIRVQFASRGWPLAYDQRYNPHPGKGQIALWASRLEFPHPVTGEMLTFGDLPQGRPWTDFEVME